MIRQSDIAKMLNISRTTVARALNGKGSINPDTKEKILTLCEELGYAKNPISTSLALKKSKSIYAFIVKTKKEVYSNSIKEGFEKAQNEFKFYKYKINIIETDIDEPKEQVKILKNILKSEQVDGVIIIPLLKDEIIKIKKENDKTVFMALDMPLDKNTYSVYSNYFKAGRITANILLNALNKGDKILLIDTEDDRISSKLVFEGFYSKVMESKKCEIVGPIFQSNLKSNIDNILENNLTKDISALYSSRFLVDIVERAISIGNENLKIVDNGFSNATKQLIKNEKVIATVAQKHSELGYLVAKYMFEYLYKDVKPKKNNNEYENVILFKENLPY
ncbi:substrate-binding domain-containing protein [Clostridium nigeriense]|uniref:substrate-binding domain-containing protein n=1 Tax=Clostridium nigeriense TaxID=1805470 RepID=UPI003D33CB75